MIIWNWFSFTVVYSAYLRFVWIWSSLLLLLWLQWYHILFSIRVDVIANCIGMIHVRCEILTILIEMNWVIFRLDFNYRHRHEAATSTASRGTEPRKRKQADNFMNFSPNFGITVNRSRGRFYQDIVSRDGEDSRARAEMLSLTSNLKPNVVKSSHH